MKKANQDDVEQRLEGLVQAFKGQPHEKIAQMLGRLRRELEEGPPPLEQLTGAVLRLSDGRVGQINIEDVSGAQHRFAAGKPLAFVPHTLGASTAPKHADDAAAAPEYGLASSALWLKLTNTGSEAATVQLDLTGLYRHSGVWGAMRLVARVTNGKNVQLAAVTSAQTSWVIDGGASAEFFGVGQSIRLDPSRLFAAMTQAPRPAGRDHDRR